MKAARIGFLGTGAIARTHASILQGRGDARVVQVYDRDPARAGAFAAEFDATVASSVRAAIRECDALFVTAPNRFHAELTLEVVDAGRHVFCEKPFALNIEDARRVAQAVEDSGVTYQLGFNRRFAPAYLTIRQMISDGVLAPRSFNIKMNRGELRRPPWTSDPEITGGFLFESTLHLLDMVRYLFGEVDDIQAVGSRSCYPCVDDFSMILRMTNGAHGVFSSCAHATWIFPFERVEAYGDHVTAFNDEMEAVSYTLGLDQETVTRRFTTLPVEERWGYRRQDGIFLQRLAGTSEPDSGFADHNDGLRNVELIEEIYAQIGAGR